MELLTKRLLITASIGHFTVALLHYAMPFLGSWAYAYFGAPELTKLAEAGSQLPAIEAFILAIIFSIFGFMSLSAAGIIQYVKAIRQILWVVGSIYVLRGLVAIVQVYLIIHGNDTHTRDIIYSLVSLTIGLIQLIGLWRSRNTKLAARINVV
jgi:hypothetical protein